MKYKGLDLNLLVALDAILATRSVSRAAEVTHVTQPAMSAALIRLRDYFGDSLIVFTGGTGRLTPLGESLARSTADALGSINTNIITRPPFDPLASRREFRILAADTVTLGLLAPPLREIMEQAPGVSLDIVTPGSSVSQELEAGRVDLVVVPESVASSRHPRTVVLEEEHRVIACQDTYDREELTLDDYAAADHVEVFIGPTRKPYLPASTFEILGFERRIAVRLDHFAMVPFFIAGTRRLATFPAMTTELHESFARLRTFPVPFLIPDVRLVMQWHASGGTDPGLRWLCTSLERLLQARAEGHQRRLYRLMPGSIC